MIEAPVGLVIGYEARVTHHVIPMCVRPVLSDSSFARGHLART